MPAKRLTDKGITRLRSATKRREIPDALTPGLYLVVQPSGKKSWAARTRVAGQNVKITLGSVAAFEDVGQARAEARRILAAAARGEDPRVLRRAAKAHTVKAVVTDWLKRDQAESRTRTEVERIFSRYVLPRWGARPVASITRADCRHLVDAIADAGAPIQANRVLARVRRLLQWCVARDLIPANPAAGLPRPGAEAARDRVLSDDELRAVWDACEAQGWPFGPAVRLLILTGARRAEIGELRWDELEEDAIRLEGERTKNGEPRRIPLSTPAREILAGLPHVGRSGYVFTTGGQRPTRGRRAGSEGPVTERPVSGWSRAKASVDDAAGVTGWRYHDLRRTVATGLQRLGQRLEVIEAVLGHTAGSRGGIVGVYQRHAFEPEKRRALDAWARHLGKVVEGKGADVVALRPR